MKLALAVHQVSSSYVKAAIGPSDEARTEVQGDEAQDAIGAIYGKVFDGLDFMSRYDPHSRSIKNLAVVEAREREHQEAGRGWVPWGNVRGLWPKEEGQLAAEVARAGAGEGERAVCIINIEPYKQFWVPRGAESRNAINAYCQAFQAAGGQELWHWTDARDWQLRELEFETWVDHYERGLVTRILPEVYWTDFLAGTGRAPDKAFVTRTLDNALDLLMRYGILPEDVYMSLPGNTTPELILHAIDWCHANSTGRPNIWQRLNVSPEILKAVAKLPDPWAEAQDTEGGEVPVDDPPPVDVRGLVEDAYRSGYTDGFLYGRGRALTEALKAGGSVELPDTIRVPGGLVP